MKLCKFCNTFKDESEFYRNSKKSDKLQYECKACALLKKAQHREKCRREGVLNYSQRTRQRLRMEVLQHYGGVRPVCSCCGEAHIEFLSIDHTNGGGNQHRLEAQVWGGFYSWLKRKGFPSGFRVLCHNCNQAYGHYGYCPHQNPTAKPLCPPRLGNRRRLTEQQIQEIKNSNEFQWKLALRYGVSQQTVSRVKGTPISPPFRTST